MFYHSFQLHQLIVTVNELTAFNLFRGVLSIWSIYEKKAWYSI